MRGGTTTQPSFCLGQMGAIPRISTGARNSHYFSTRRRTNAYAAVPCDRCTVFPCTTAVYLQQAIVHALVFVCLNGTTRTRPALTHHHVWVQVCCVFGPLAYIVVQRSATLSESWSACDRCPGADFSCLNICGHVFFRLASLIVYVAHHNCNYTQDLCRRPKLDRMGEWSMRMTITAFTTVANEMRWTCPFRTFGHTRIAHHITSTTATSHS